MTIFRWTKRRIFLEKLQTSFRIVFERARTRARIFSSESLNSVAALNNAPQVSDVTLRKEAVVRRMERGGFQMRTRDERMNYFRERAIKRDVCARVTSLKNYRRLLRRAINHASSCALSNALAYRFIGSNRSGTFPTRKIHSDGAPGAYSNLYRRELKDYVINAR